MESEAIPINSIRKVLVKLPYGCPCRVMFQMLLYTGCRISELNVMKLKDLNNNIIYWRVGKNQKGQERKAELPKCYVEELVEYRQNNRVYADQLFGVDDRSFVRYFNKKCRSVIGDEWLVKDERHPGNYVLQLKGLRKTNATLRFWREYKEWDDPMIALEMTSKAMKHKTTNMTSYHYIRNFASLGICKETPVFVVQSLSGICQKRISDY